MTEQAKVLDLKEITRGIVAAWMMHVASDEDIHAVAKMAGELDAKKGENK